MKMTIKFTDKEAARLELMKFECLKKPAEFVMVGMCSDAENGPRIGALMPARTMELTEQEATLLMALVFDCAEFEGHKGRIWRIYCGMARKIHDAALSAGMENSDIKEMSYAIGIPD